MKRNRIKKKYNIPDPKEALRKKEETIKFSFRYYDTACKDYCLSEWTQEDISLSLKRLQDINNKTFSEIGKGNLYHFHEVQWDKTIKKNGFPSVSANSLHAFQFALVGVNNQKARVYGALSDSTFYIVWFDLEHQIWPAFKKHT